MADPVTQTTRHPVFHPLKVAAVDRLLDDAVAITFDVPADLADDYAFTHGQHVTVLLPESERVNGAAADTVRRNYSICSPASSGVLRIAVKGLPDGVFSAYALHRLEVGHEIEVMTPTGRFFTRLDPANAKHYACIAAGSGITPILSIVASTLAAEPHSRVTLLYANRTSETVMFLEELEDLKDTYPERFQLVHILSREQQAVELFSGRLDGERLLRIAEALLPLDTVDDWFICGPHQMAVDLRTTLLKAGVGKRQIHAEIFHVDTEPRRPPERPGPGAPAGAPANGAANGAADGGAEEGAEVTVRLDGRTSQLRLRGDGPVVLDAVLAARPDAPFACKGGVCGTCRAKLVDGTVEMEQNWALEADELDQGYVLTCQSHPTSAKVVLDYDA